jgi:3-oxoacyl-[acyl-carrier protein] reductase
MAVADWEDTFANNTRSVFLCSQAVIRHFKSQRWGRVLNTSSFAALVPSYAFAAYAASKAAVTTFTRVLAAELGPWNVTVNAVAPGMVPTLLSRFAEAKPERQTALLNTLAVRRWETPEDIASLLVFLASDHAAYITGTMIDVSGGKFCVQFPSLAYDAADIDPRAQS